MLDKINFILHNREEEFGKSIFIMDENGKSFGRIYYYYDDNNTYYIEGLSVSRTERKQGIGNSLLDFLEKTIKNNAGKKVLLWCDKYSWVKEWYIRKGYFCIKDHEYEENCIWMKKILSL